MNSAQIGPNNWFIVKNDMRDYPRFTQWVYWPKVWWERGYQISNHTLWLPVIDNAYWGPWKLVYFAREGMYPVYLCHIICVKCLFPISMSTKVFHINWILTYPSHFILSSKNDSGKCSVYVILQRWQPLKFRWSTLVNNTALTDSNLCIQFVAEVEKMEKTMLLFSELQCILSSFKWNFSN